MSVLVYNVSGLVKEPVGSTREYVVDDDVPVDHGERHMTGLTRMLRTDGGVLVSAEIDGIERGECARCAADIETQLHLSFDEEFFSSVDAKTGAALPMPDEPDAFRIDAQQVLDLDEAVRQWWTASIPMQALCRPDCKGLCPRCGKDLNEGPCACGPENDERWAALAELANKIEGD